MCMLNWVDLLLFELMIFMKQIIYHVNNICFRFWRLEEYSESKSVFLLWKYIIKSRNTQIPIDRDQISAVTGNVPSRLFILKIHS